MTPTRPSPRVPEIDPWYAFLLYMAMLIPIVSSPFGTTLSLIFATLAAIIGVVVREEALFSALRSDQVMIALLIFAGFGAFSASWSPDPMETLAKSTLLALAATAGVLSVRSAFSTSPEVATAATRGFLVVCAILAVHAMIEIVSDQALLKWSYNAFPSTRDADFSKLRIEEGRVVFVNEIFLNRLVYVVTLFGVPAWLATFVLDSSWKRGAAQVAIATVLITIVVLSQHESSRLAIVAAAVVVATGVVAYRAAVGVVSVGWGVATLLVVPIMLLMGAAKLDESTALPESARDRVKIWRHTSQAVFKGPLFGHGAASTPTVYESEFSAAVNKLALTATEKRERMMQYRRERALSDRLGPHAHNIYLQIWFELGLVGALLLAAVGVAILRQITRIQDQKLRLLGLAQFTLVATSSATSYSLWQPWYLSLIALSLIFMAIAARAAGSRGLVASEPLGP